ncbi:MAG: hypothetical protein KGN35_07015 [Betaproteobacteria bacterium]|nr:hypothetical protein [Betaproteobacteria bacterium]
MRIVRDPASINGIPDPGIRDLVSQRFSQILSGESYDYNTHGYMIVVEPGDSIDSLESETSCPILHNTFDGSRYGEADFTPCFEALEEHSHCYEMLFILSDSGSGIELFIPKHPGIDADLLAMCAEYAVPATALTHS